MSDEAKPVSSLTIVNGNRIHVYSGGNKNNPTLVFLAGSGTVSPVYDFKILYQKLSDDFRIVVVEKFGYGYSDVCEISCHIDSLISIERQALKNVDEKGPFILVPHSMGGLEAIRWKQKYPNEVKAIIGIDMATPLTYNNWTEKDISKRTRLMKMAKALKLSNVLCQINNRSLTTSEIEQHKLLKRKNAFNICYINEANAVLNNSKIVSGCGNIECPTLLFCSNGKQTSKNWINEQKSFAEVMSAKLVCFDCGHYIHHYKSSEMVDVIKEFINDKKLR